MQKEDVLRRIEEAEKGRLLWLDLVEKHKIKDHDQVVLFPSGYDEWAYYGALYLDDFLFSRDSTRAIVLCHDEKIKQCILKYSQNPEIIHFSREEAEKIITLYGLYLFTDNLTIFSPVEPAGRNGKNFVAIKGVTIEEVAALTLYRLVKIKGVPLEDSKKVVLGRIKRVGDRKTISALHDEPERVTNE